MYSFKLTNETLRGQAHFLSAFPDIEWFILVCLWCGVIVGDKKIIPSKGIKLFSYKAKHIYLQDNQEVHKLQAKKKT